ncbi:MAG: murein transglycosylase A [Litorimonas sp.]
MRRVGRVLKSKRGTIAGLLAVISLSACTTTQTPQSIEPETEVYESAPNPPSEPSGDPVAEPRAPALIDPDLTRPTTPPTDPLPPTIVDVPDVGLGAAVEPVAPEPLLEQPDPFARLSGWSDADHAPALAAFQRSCVTLLKRPAKTVLHAKRSDLGRHSDWANVCRAAKYATNATPFFESLFVPVTLSRKTGLLTGYYEPEVEVRAKPDAVFSEPILTVPTSDAIRTLPRAKLSAQSADVIAYGRPIDVFFLHVQGSGRLHFDDGRTVRAGYAANNGKRYRSIGRVLIDRGELTRDQSAKRNIEQWMDAAGAEKSRALMNENPRYIFFSEQDVSDGVGPKGAMQVPLTAMGSIAVDPKHNPYGIPVWLETRLPQKARDYQGTSTGLLVVTQDTGSAIKGPRRGDLFFGAGSNAGALAGVLKHPVRWTTLLPRTLVERLKSQEPQDEPVA